MAKKIEKREWVWYLRNGGEAVVILVKEFYSNAKIIDGKIKTYVRRTHIDVDKAAIQEIRQELPRVDRPTYPPKKIVELDIVGRELTGVATFSWSRRKFLK